MERFNLSSDKIFLFGRNSELPQQDTLDFTQLESWI
ncbi:Predicted ATPase specific for cyanobacteria [Synechococcus sp. CC9311]|nr:Predicted ATPase specific for cyanobacteria [Synechococcus sp. CC9311]